MALGNKHPSHSWEDVSYHGSPDYECRYCSCTDYGREADLPCPKAETALKREAQIKEDNERAEYAQMKAKIERYLYLDGKYGNEKGKT